MATPKPWVFQQLGGDKKTFKLSGSAAPHGRPRKSPILNDAIQIRESTTYFSGVARPTRHLHGPLYDDWELVGRWEDRFLGAGGAIAKAREAELFVRDQQPILIKWGDILSYYGFVKRLERQREAEWAIAWKLRIALDENADIETQATSPAVQTPSDMTAQINALLADYSTQLPSASVDGVNINADFLDSLDDAMTAINLPATTLAQLADQMQSFEKALAGELRRVRAAVANVSTAIYTMRASIDAFTEDQIVTYKSSATLLTWNAWRARTDVSVTIMLALLADLDRAAEIALRGRNTTTTVARDGETWEQIATRLLGGPEGAPRIRDMNGVRFGERPVGGKTYTVPIDV